MKKDFDKHMIAALDTWRKAATASDKKLKGKDAYKLDMPQVRKTGEAAQQVVTGMFGDVVSGATFHADTNARKAGYDVGSSAVLHEQKETVDGVPATEHPDIALGLVIYATNQTNGGQPVMDSHHVDRSRVDDQTEYDKVVQAYAKKHEKELLEIQRNWPGEEHPWDGTIYIRLENMKDPDLSKKEKGGAAKFADANLRSGYWGSFQTLIHEYLHACAHAELQKAANTDRGLTHQILIEGGCDYYTEKAWLAIEPTLSGDAALREKVEGKPYPYAAEVIPAPSYYDEKEDVKKIVAALGGDGEANFKAAYFMGHVELIGLGKWKKEQAGDQDAYVAPIDDFAIAEVAKRCNVTEESIADDNSLTIGDKVAKGTRLVVKGVRHHIALSGDTYADLAKQHGVTEASLTQANPFVTSLYAGADVVIPVH